MDKMDFGATPLVTEDAHLYYPTTINTPEGQMAGAEDEVNYNVQLFLTSIGTDKYHLKSTMPAIRPDLGGQPSLLVTVSLALNEKKDKKFIIPFHIQNISGYLQLVCISPLEYHATFRVEGDVLAIGYLSPTRLYLNAPESQKEITALRKARKEKERTRQGYLQRKFKTLWDYL